MQIIFGNTVLDRVWTQRTRNGIRQAVGLPLAGCADKERGKMIKVGDTINVKATCLNISDNAYLFTLMEIPQSDPFIIALSDNDKAHNQQIHDCLEKLKVK